MVEEGANRGVGGRVERGRRSRKEEGGEGRKEEKGRGRRGPSKLALVEKLWGSLSFVSCDSENEDEEDDTSEEEGGTGVGQGGRRRPNRSFRAAFRRLIIEYYHLSGVAKVFFCFQFFQIFLNYFVLVYLFFPCPIFFFLSGYF
jgi:hypothetical protein